VLLRGFDYSSWLWVAEENREIEEKRKRGRRLPKPTISCGDVRLEQR